MILHEAETELPEDLRASTFHPPTLDMLAEGYQVYPVADAVGGISHVAHDQALERMRQALHNPA